MQEKQKVDSTYMKALSEVIAKRRRISNKSMYLASAESSIAKSSWRDIERGLRKNINLSTFCKIAEGLNMEPWELLKELCEKLGKDFSFTDLD